MSNNRFGICIINRIWYHDHLLFKQKMEKNKILFQNRTHRYLKFIVLLSLGFTSLKTMPMCFTSIFFI